MACARPHARSRRTLDSCRSAGLWVWVFAWALAWPLGWRAAEPPGKPDDCRRGKPEMGRLWGLAPGTSSGSAYTGRRGDIPRHAPSATWVKATATMRSELFRHEQRW